MLPTKRMVKSMYKMRLLAMHIIVICVLFIPFVADIYCFTFKTNQDIFLPSPKIGMKIT